MSVDLDGAKRQVNDLMRDGLRQRGDREQIAFFCECEDQRCYQAVWMTGPEYDDARADPAWAPLTTGHRLAMMVPVSPAGGDFPPPAAAA